MVGPRTLRLLALILLPLAFAFFASPMRAALAADHGGGEKKAEGGEHGGGKKEEKKEKKSKGKKEERPLPPNYVRLSDLTGTITSAHKDHSHFMLASILLELKDPLDADHIKVLRPRLIQEFESATRDFTDEDLSGGVGMNRLRADLLARIKKVAEPVEITDVLFERMILR